jgi:hypothetical protein
VQHGRGDGGDHGLCNFFSSLNKSSCFLCPCSSPSFPMDSNYYYPYNGESSNGGYSGHSYGNSDYPESSVDELMGNPSPEAYAYQRDSDYADASLYPTAAFDAFQQGNSLTQDAIAFTNMNLDISGYHSGLENQTV